MRFYPASLLITAVVLLPNLAYLAFPPLNLKKYGLPNDSRFLTAIERVGQVSSFILPIFFRLSFVGTQVAVAWAVMGLSLAVYYAGWVRFFSRGRDYALLYKPMLAIPVPMAVSPVVLFFVSSIVLGSVWQALAAVVLGSGHITITAREMVRVARVEETSK